MQQKLTVEQTAWITERIPSPPTILIYGYRLSSQSKPWKLMGQFSREQWAKETGSSGNLLEWARKKDARVVIAIQYQGPEAQNQSTPSNSSEAKPETNPTSQSPSS